MTAPKKRVQKAADGIRVANLPLPRSIIPPGEGGGLRLPPDYWSPRSERGRKGRRNQDVFSGTLQGGVSALAKGGSVKPKLTKAQGAKASAKISHLAKMEPGMPPKQRVAMAMNMAREGRLGPGGTYKPKKAKASAKK